MTARPAPGLVLCRLDEIEDPGAKGFRFREGEAEFAGFVVRVGETVAGYVDACPHAGWPLALFDRYLTREKDLILCSGHGALFRREDGVCIAGPCADDRLSPWPVAVSGDEVVTA
ncbi:MAG TPA: Rieske 2Fe-2S domain-containing protein [Caulobacteraceae bacterium]|nr:Rieske 2Fe-2S domain-containing protein [Caulobacteraceae bacterium]